MRDCGDDGSSDTSELQPATFHARTFCTAEDVAFCVNRAVFAENPSRTFIFSAVVTISATDLSTPDGKLEQGCVPSEVDLALPGESIFSHIAFQGPRLGR